MFNNFFAAFDLFRQPLFFYYNGSTKRTSFLGFFSSILIYCYLFYSFFQSNLYLKNKPIVVSENIDNNHAEAIYFNAARPLYIAITDPLNNRFTDPTYFRLIFRYFHNQSYFEERDLKLCDIEDANGNLTFYEFYNLGKMFCLKNNSFFLEGSIEEGQRYVAVSILLCDNVTSNNTCKSSEEIFKYFDSFISQKYFSIIFDDHRIEINDYNSPMKNLKKIIYQLIDPNIKKKYMINFKKITVATDLGLISSDIHKVSEFAYSSMDLDFQIRVNQQQPLSQFILLSTKEELLYNRSYQTLAEFLANFFGVSKLFSMICVIFVNNFIHVRTLKHLMNKLYALPPVVKKRKKHLKKIKKKTKKNTTTSILQNTTKTYNNIIDIKTINFAESKPISHLSKLGSGNSRGDHPFILSHENEKKLILFSPDRLEDIAMKSSNKSNSDIDMKKRENEKDLKFQISEFSKNEPLVYHPSIEFNQVFQKNLQENDSFVLEHFSEHQQDSKKEASKEKILSLDLGNILKYNQKKSNEKEHEKKDTIIENEKIFEINKSKKVKEKTKKFFKENKQDKSKNKFNFSFCEYLYMKMNIFKSKKNLKKRLIEKAEKSCQEDLDVVNMVTKLHDLDKLKSILLDSDQLAIFDYLSKPIIKFDDEKEYISSQQKAITNIRNREKTANFSLEESYIKVLQKNDKISEKLIEFFDNEISYLSQMEKN